MQYPSRSTRSGDSCTRSLLSLGAYGKYSCPRSVIGRLDTTQLERRKPMEAEDVGVRSEFSRMSTCHNRPVETLSQIFEFFLRILTLSRPESFPLAAQRSPCNIQVHVNLHRQIHSNGPSLTGRLYDSLVINFHFGRPQMCLYSSLLATTINDARYFLL